MKFLHLIIGFYILFLSCAPCIDNDDCKSEESDAITATTNKNESHNENDNCSPFCVCSCCGYQGFTLIQMEKFNAFTISDSRLICTYNLKFTNFFQAKIWQPPRIS